MPGMLRASALEAAVEGCSVWVRCARRRVSCVAVAEAALGEIVATSDVRVPPCNTSCTQQNLH